MLKSFREIRKEIYNKKNLIPHEHDNDGRVIVDLRVANDDCFLSPYSTENHSVISSEVSDFIEHSLSSVKNEERIHLRIHSDCITDEEKREYTDAIHSYYSDCFKNSALEKRKLRGIAIIMAIIATAALFFNIWLEVSGRSREVFYEIVDIFAWVFMWEAVDIAFFQCSLLRFKQRRYLSLADCVIEYLPLGNKENSLDPERAK